MIVFPSCMHSHTHYGDGKNSPEEMILAAINLGFGSFGFAEHAWAAHDLDVCIPKDKMQAYRDEILQLKEKYADKIEVYCGLEVEYHGLHDKGGWDYILCSSHYVHCAKTGKYYLVDRLPADFEAGVNQAGEGSVQKFVEMYGANIMDIARSYRPDIIGHIDLVTKLNRGKRFFDPGASWYKSMWETVAGAIAQSGCVVEVNTGGMARGYTDEPYPGADILRILHRQGVPVTLCSDAHQTDTLAYGYGQALQLLRGAGYQSIKLWQKGGFTDFSI